MLVIFGKQQGDQWLQCDEHSFIHCTFIPWIIIARAVRGEMGIHKELDEDES